MGSEGYLLWNDAIYGNSGNWFSSNYCFSKNSIMVAIGSIWTVKNISLVSKL